MISELTVKVFIFLAVEQEILFVSTFFKGVTTDL